MHFSILFPMLTKLIPLHILEIIKKSVSLSTITELRLRKGRKTVIKTANRVYVLDYKPNDEDFTYVIKIATRNSLYSYQDEIRNGYIPYHGIRIGVSGRGVTDKDRLITIKDFTSLTIRIPREIIGVSSPLTHIINNFENTLVISPPYGGKTTLIRDIARVLSNNYETLIIDEREEIYNDKYTFGEKLDVFLNTPKHLIVEGVIRSLSPEIIVLDELFAKTDLEVLREITRCGIKILASLHGENFNLLNAHYPNIFGYFTNVIELSNKPRVGSIKSIVRLK